MCDPGDRAVEKMLESIRDERLAKQDQQIVDASARFEAGYAAGYREGLRQAGWIEEVVAGGHELSQLKKMDGTARRWRRVGHPYRESPELEPEPSRQKDPQRALRLLVTCLAIALVAFATDAASRTPYAFVGVPAGAVFVVVLSLIATTKFIMRFIDR